MIEYCNNYHIRVYKILPRIMISHSRLSVHVSTAKLNCITNLLVSTVAEIVI